MDGVSLAESLLYKDYDELQRLIKGCSIGESQNILRNSIVASMNEKSGCKCENLSNMYSRMVTKNNSEIQTCAAAFITDSNQLEERVHLGKSLLKEPVRINSVLESPNRQLPSFPCHSQTHCKEDLGHNCVENEGMTFIPHPLKRTDNQLHVNSSILDTNVQPQTMVSTFRLNAELPVVPSTTKCMISEFSTQFTPMSKGHYSSRDDSRLHNQRSNLNIFALNNKVPSNGMPLAISNCEAQFSLPSNHAANIANVASTNCKSIAEQLASVIYYTNNINSELNKDVEQNTENAPAKISNVKSNHLSKTELLSDRNAFRTIVSSSSLTNDISIDKSISNKGLLEQHLSRITANSTQYLLPEPVVNVKHYALESNRRGMQNIPIGQICADVFNAGCPTKEIPNNVAEEALTEYGPVVSQLSNVTHCIRQPSLESKGNKYSMKPIQLCTTSHGRNSSMSTVNNERFFSKKPFELHFPYEKMCEQHFYLKNDLEQITNSLAPYLSKLELSQCLDETASRLGATRTDLENEMLALYSSYEKASNLTALVDKLRPGTIPLVIVSTLEGLLVGIRKLQLYSCALNISMQDAQERLTGVDANNHRFDLSNISQILAELTDQLRKLRTALWACVQRIGWTGASSYVQAVYSLAELANRGLPVRPLNNMNGSNLLQAPSVVSVSQPYKGSARPLMDLRPSIDVTHCPTASVAPVSGNNNSRNNVTNPRGLVYIPGAAGATNLCLPPRHLINNPPSSTACAMFTQPTRYVPEQVVVPDTGAFPTGQVNSVYSHSLLFPHTTPHPGQSTLIMPSSFLPTHLSRSTNLTRQVCNLQPGTRLTDHL